MTILSAISLEIDSSNSEAWKNVRIDPKKSLGQAELTLAKATEENYEKGIAWANAIIGAAHAWTSDYENALHYSFLASEQLKACREFKMEAQVYYTIAVIFYFLGEYDKQRSYAQKNLEISKSINDKEGIASALNGIGTGFYSDKEFKLAIETLEKAEKAAIDAGSDEVLGRIYDGLGQSYLGLNEFDKALEYKHLSLSISNKLGSLQVQSFSHEGLGQIYQRLKNYDKALEHYNIALELRKQVDFIIGIAYTNLRIGETLCESGNPDKGLDYFKEVIEIGNNVKSNELLFKAHERLSEIYDKRRDLENYVIHLKAFHHYKDIFQSETENKKIKAYELKGKLEQVQTEKEELEKKNKDLEKFFDDVKVLSSIGNEITSTLDLQSIFNIIYERINALMDAQGIFVGICNYEENKIEVPLAIDKGIRDQYFEYSLDDFDKKLPVYAVKHNQTIHINDYQEEIRNYITSEEEMIHNTPESLILIPLMVKDIVIGVLLAQSSEKYAFTAHHLNILQSFSSYLSIALDNAYLYGVMEKKIDERTAELQQSYENSELLNKIGQELISTLNFEDVFETLYNNVNKLMDATVFGVRLLNKELDQVEYLYEYERGKRLGRIIVPMSNDNNYSVWSIKHKKEIFIVDHENEYKQYVDQVMVVDGDFPYSLIFYPLIDDNEVFGCISVQCFEKHAYTPYHLSIVKTLAQYTTIALQNARHYEVMEEKVNERTKEITRTYENTKLLSEVGKSITAQLSVENIIKVAYDNINKLMAAEGFGIGIFNKEDNTLEFPGYIESGVRLDGSCYSLEDNNRLACVCFNKEMDIVINDFSQDYSKYIDIYLEPQVGKSVTSLIYLPIRSKDKIVGVITVQSFEKDSYRDYHLNMLRSIGVYTGIALDNASLYENMEELVEERTTEILNQKEEIERSYHNTKLISQINRDIAQSITIESIIAKVYENVNNLMDAACFGIGIYDAKRNAIRMPGFIEKGVRLEEFEYLTSDQRLASWCFNEQKEIWINDYSKEYKDYISGIQTPVSGQDSCSIIYIPLFSKEKIVGLITVQSFDLAAYSEYHIDILRGLAATIASAIENATLYENLEEKVKERTQEVVKQKEQIERTAENTKLLSEVGKEIASELSSKDIISKVYKNINNMMDATVFGIGVYQQEDNTLFFSGAIEKGEILKDFEYSLEEERIAVLCFKETREYIINDWILEHKKYVTKDYSAAAGEMPYSMMYVPLISKGNTIGVMTVQSFEKDIYGAYELDILRTLSLYIASALENASLYEDMENRVKERTKEIEKAYEDTKLLSQISKTIVQSLEIESIIKSVYNNINTLLDATCFGIGLYDEDSRKLKLPGFIENGVALDNIEYSIDEDFLATNCFLNNEEVFIRDYNSEFKNFLDDDIAPISGDVTNSIIYLPLNTNEKVIGVITVQSYKTNAYSEYHLDILRSLATTIATALDNALLYESLEEKVRDRTRELVKQNEIIEEKNKHITDSIRYAKRIQDATLPDHHLVETYLKEAFVLFKPKDIVSGDFYWLERVGNKILFAVVDCTGHGVPGAFLSLIGHNSLNQIVNELGIIEPGAILNNLNKILHHTLKSGHSDSNTIRDGMDLTICSLDTETNFLQFAGANNPIYLIQDGELVEIKGDKVPIGADDGKQHFEYTNHGIQLKQGDTIYLFSDGYADQFGGPRGKKMKYSAFKEILLEIQNENMPNQRDILNDRIELWQGDLEQIDDVCIMGVKL